LADAPTVLVTRPEPGGAETAARLAAMGWRALAMPALVLRPRRLELPPCQAVLLTSRAAARALPPPVPGLALLAVGEATAEVARQAGWTTAQAAGGTAEDLARLAAERFDAGHGPLLLAVGQGYALDLAADLRRRGFRVLRRVAYAASPADAVPEAVLAALRQGDPPRRVLFHSPRSAACAITLLREAGLAAALAEMTALAISPRVAEAARTALAPLAWRDMRVAGQPTEDALLALLGPGNTVPDGQRDRAPLTLPGEP
jgi:uroporphyrinogen-III synthase